MKKFLLLAAFVFAFIPPLLAQKVSGVVKGSLKDSISRQGIRDASVSVISQRDSALVSFTITGNTGDFEIKNLHNGAYLLLVSVESYTNIKKTFTITSLKPVIDYGTINIDREYKILGEVIVKDEAPIKMKGDTIAYNANSFKINKPNATVEDLLKKLPGVQVDKDGTVKAQGESVQKIYVDGKEFFGNDPRMATKNLAADMIDQVELYDETSEQSKFSGIDDGNRSKAINLKLKKEKKKGLFGRASVGYGTSDRNESSLSVNYFKGATKLSVIAREGNTNNTGFGSSDMTGMPGGVGSSKGGINNPSGLNKYRAAGINYSDFWGKGLELTGNYFFNRTGNNNISQSHRETFFPDSTVTRALQSLTGNNNDNHRINFKFTYTIDSLTSFVYIPNINFQNTKTFRNDTTESFASQNSASYKVNDSRSIRENNGDGMNWTNNLLFRRRFSKRGRTISVNLSSANNHNNRNGSTASRTGRYENNGNIISDSTINQINNQKSATNNYAVTLSYTEPLGRDKVLELNYSYKNNQTESDREVFDLNTNTGKYDLANLQQTNLFENGSEANRLGANFRVVKKKYNYQLGLALQRTLLQSKDVSKNLVIEQTFTNIFPMAAFNYQFARSKSFRFRYRGQSNQPGVTQLQPGRDVSNPLYQTEGNPLLKQEYTNNFSVSYNSFDMESFRSFFLQVDFSNTYNNVVNSIEQLGQGVQLIRPVNANGAYQVSGNLSADFPINKMKGGNINSNTTVYYNRDVSIADQVKNFTSNLVLGEELRLNYQYKEKLEIGIGAGVSYNSARYTQSKDRNVYYYTYAASADISYIFPKNYVLSSDLDYTTNTGLASGFNQNYFLWNAGFAKQLFKNNRGELKLTVYDILKQNRSVTRSIADNYVDDVQNTVLQRFFLLSFTYNLNRHGQWK